MMKAIAFFLILSTCAAYSMIVVDQFGYLSGSRKMAVIKVPQVGQDAGTYQTPPGDTLLLINNANDAVVFRGASVPWNSGVVHAQSGDRAWHFDFSSVTASGVYRIEDPESGRVSPVFEIRQNPWRDVLTAAMRTFFYQRSGFAKEARFAGENWADGAAFLQERETRDYFDPNNPARFRDLHGGWFDAGDYNKYITFTTGVIHALVTAYEVNPEIWGDDTNIPESGNGLPDILDEIKWKMDWVLRMQVEDGGVIIKMGEIDYNSASPPSADTRTRYYGRVSTSSTIGFASMTARAAMVFRRYTQWESFADTLTAAARRAWEFYASRPVKDTDSDLGEIEAGDADWTLEDQLAEEATFGVYMFALTGEQQWNDLVVYRHDEVPVMNWWWGPYHTHRGEALLYYTTLPGANSTVVSSILQMARTRPTPFYGDQMHIDPYFAAIPDAQYHWGSLSLLSLVGAINLNFIRFVDTASAQVHRQRALDIIHYIHGRNPLNRSYLSNMYDYGAENPVNEFFHSWFRDGSVWDNALTSERGGPPPGFLVGGPNATFEGNRYVPAGLPPQKMYADFNTGWPYNSWEITENSTGYQANFIRILAEFVSLSDDVVFDSGLTTSVVESAAKALEVKSEGLISIYPNPFNPVANILFNVNSIENAKIEIVDVVGRTIKSSDITTQGNQVLVFNGANHASGIYFVVLTIGNRTYRQRMLLLK